MNGSHLQRYRPALARDVVWIARLLKERYAKFNFEELFGIPFDYQTVLELVVDVIGRGVCIVGHSSCAGALLVPAMSDQKQIIAQVLFWHFKSPREILIFEKLAEACKDRGAMFIGAASHFPDNRIGRFYEKIGMKPIEVNYLAPIEKLCQLGGK